MTGLHPSEGEVREALAAAEDSLEPRSVSVPTTGGIARGFADYQDRVGPVDCCLQAAAGKTDRRQPDSFRHGASLLLRLLHHTRLIMLLSVLQPCHQGQYLVQHAGW